MARDGFFTGLDIGTSSIKVLVAEHINDEMNVIGVSNAKSAGNGLYRIRTKRIAEDHEESVQ